jgi:hypothetical protein
MANTKFGPGTVSYTIGAGPAVSFEQEVKGGGIEHEYEEVGESTTYLDGTTDPAGEVRADKLTLDCDFDLGAGGFYAFLMSNDLVDADVEYTPNTAAAASWSGTVRLKLPDGAVADEFGAKLSGTVEHSFVGPVVFTPTPAAP